MNPEDGPGIRFGTLIKDARVRRGWTQDRLVEESGVSRATIKRWESGDVRAPTPHQIRAVCLALGVDPRQAAVTLGFITHEESGLPQPPDPALSATEEEILEILRDPNVSDATRLEWRDYLVWQHGRRRSTASRN